MAAKENMTTEPTHNPLPGQQPEVGYDAWLKARLERAVEDLDDPSVKRHSHEQVFDELDAIIAKHEAS